LITGQAELPHGLSFAVSFSVLSSVSRAARWAPRLVPLRLL